jgi:catechol 2,3-dioxygenase-like lactoylglutathione lyase family enzyme
VDMPSVPDDEFTGVRGSVARRWALKSLGALAAAPWLACADTSAREQLLDLPLRLRQVVNHIGISVPDVVKSATFYSRLFDGPRIVGQVKPALRYSIDFDPGAMAIGSIRDAAPGGSPPPPSRGFIDHVCVAAEPFDLAAWRARLAQEGVRSFARGTFVEIGDIPVQLLGGHEASARPAGAGAKGAAAGGFKPMPPLYTGRPLVTAHGFEHVVVQVADLEAAARLFHKLFGLAPKSSATGHIWFGLGGIRLGLEQAVQGRRASIASYAIKVSAFDTPTLTDELQTLGAMVEPLERHGTRSILRFSDPDGIMCELWTV